MYQLTDSKEVSRRDMDKEQTGARESRRDMCKEQTGARETRSRTNRLAIKDRLRRERTKC